MLHVLPSLNAQLSLAIFVFLFTLLYEDAATLLAATLGIAGRLDVRLGFLSAFLGIWAGDMGLYVVGSQMGQRVGESRWFRRFISAESLSRAQSWFARRGTVTIALSRLVPGSRLPLYFAAGALKYPASLFGLLTGICSLLWVGAIFLSLRFSPVAHFTPWKALATLSVGLLLCPWLVAKAFKWSIPKARLFWKKYRRWEFWPAWLFYPPVAVMCGWLAVKYRGLALPTLANPSFRNGGIVGESKVEALHALRSVAPEFVADAYLLPTGASSERVRLLRRICDQHELSYPVVLKPDVGQRGAGFKVMKSDSDVERYLSRVKSDLIVQRYIPGEKEVGIFYYRFPGAIRGEIFAITEKVFPVVTGDGVRTVEQLVASDDRASLIAKTYLDRFRSLRKTVLANGQVFRLVEAGNHCQGCIFRDGQHLLSQQLRDRIDQISQSLSGFFIGRYDIRYSSDDDLIRGKNFKIIELNGAASEATNVYDERNSLFAAYRTLYRQWELVYAIGRANRNLGHTSPAIWSIWKDWNYYRSMSAVYPAAD